MVQIDILKKVIQKKREGSSNSEKSKTSDINKLKQKLNTQQIGCNSSNKYTSWSQQCQGCLVPQSDQIIFNNKTLSKTHILNSTENNRDYFDTKKKKMNVNILDPPPLIITTQSEKPSDLDNMKGIMYKKNNEGKEKQLHCGLKMSGGNINLCAGPSIKKGVTGNGGYLNFYYNKTLANNLTNLFNAKDTIRPNINDCKAKNGKTCNFVQYYCCRQNPGEFIKNGNFYSQWGLSDWGKAFDNFKESQIQNGNQLWNNSNLVNSNICKLWINTPNSSYGKKKTSCCTYTNKEIPPNPQINYTLGCTGCQYSSTQGVSFSNPIFSQTKTAGEGSLILQGSLYLSFLSSNYNNPKRLHTDVSKELEVTNPINLSSYYNIFYRHYSNIRNFNTINMEQLQRADYAFGGSGSGRGGGGLFQPISQEFPQGLNNDSLAFEQPGMESEKNSTALEISESVSDKYLIPDFTKKCIDKYPGSIYFYNSSITASPLAAETGGCPTCDWSKQWGWHYSDKSGGARFPPKDYLFCSQATNSHNIKSEQDDYIFFDHTDQICKMFNSQFPMDPNNDTTYSMQNWCEGITQYRYKCSYDESYGNAKCITSDNINAKPYYQCNNSLKWVCGGGVPGANAIKNSITCSDCGRQDNQGFSLNNSSVLGNKACLNWPSSDDQYGMCGLCTQVCPEDEKFYNTKSNKVQSFSNLKNCIDHCKPTFAANPNGAYETSTEYNGLENYLPNKTYNITTPNWYIPKGDALCALSKIDSSVFSNKNCSSVMGFLGPKSYVVSSATFSDNNNRPPVCKGNSLSSCTKDFSSNSFSKITTKSYVSDISSSDEPACNCDSPPLVPCTGIDKTTCDDWARKCKCSFDYTDCDQGQCHFQIPGPEPEPEPECDCTKPPTLKCTDISTCNNWATKCNCNFQYTGCEINQGNKFCKFHAEPEPEPEPSGCYPDKVTIKCQYPDNTPCNNWVKANCKAGEIIEEYCKSNNTCYFKKGGVWPPSPSDPLQRCIGPSGNSYCDARMKSYGYAGGYCKDNKGFFTCQGSGSEGNPPQKIPACECNSCGGPSGDAWCQTYKITQDVSTDTRINLYCDKKDSQCKMYGGSVWKPDGANAVGCTCASGGCDDAQGNWTCELSMGNDYCLKKAGGEASVCNASKTTDGKPLPCTCSTQPTPGSDMLLIEDEYLYCSGTTDSSLYGATGTIQIDTIPQEADDQKIYGIRSIGPFVSGYCNNLTKIYNKYTINGTDKNTLLNKTAIGCNGCWTSTNSTGIDPSKWSCFLNGEKPNTYPGVWSIDKSQINANVIDTYCTFMSINNNEYSAITGGGEAGQKIFCERTANTNSPADIPAFQSSVCKGVTSSIRCNLKELMYNSSDTSSWSPKVDQGSDEKKWMNTSQDPGKVLPCTYVFEKNIDFLLKNPNGADYYCQLISGNKNANCKFIFGRNNLNPKIYADSGRGWTGGVCFDGTNNLGIPCGMKSNFYLPFTNNADYMFSKYNSRPSNFPMQIPSGIAYATNNNSNKIELCPSQQNANLYCTQMLQHKTTKQTKETAYCVMDGTYVWQLTDQNKYMWIKSKLPIVNYNTLNTDCQTRNGGSNCDSYYNEPLPQFYCVRGNQGQSPQEESDNVMLFDDSNWDKYASNIVLGNGSSGVLLTKDVPQDGTGSVTGSNGSKGPIYHPVYCGFSGASNFQFNTGCGITNPTISKRVYRYRPCYKNINPSSNTDGISLLGDTYCKLYSEQIPNASWNQDVFNSSESNCIVNSSSPALDSKGWSKDYDKWSDDWTDHQYDPTKANNSYTCTKNTKFKCGFMEQVGTQYCAEPDPKNPKNCLKYQDTTTPQYINNYCSQWGFCPTGAPPNSQIPYGNGCNFNNSNSQTCPWCRGVCNTCKNPGVSLNCNFPPGGITLGTEQSIIENLGKCNDGNGISCGFLYAANNIQTTPPYGMAAPTTLLDTTGNKTAFYCQNCDEDTIKPCNTNYGTNYCWKQNWGQNTFPQQPSSVGKTIQPKCSNNASLNTTCQEITTLIGGKTTQTSTSIPCGFTGHNCLKQNTCSLQVCYTRDQVFNDCNNKNEYDKSSFKQGDAYCQYWLNDEKAKCINTDEPNSVYPPNFRCRRGNNTDTIYFCGFRPVSSSINSNIFCLTSEKHVDCPNSPNCNQGDQFCKVNESPLSTCITGQYVCSVNKTPCGRDNACLPCSTAPQSIVSGNNCSTIPFNTFHEYQESLKKQRKGILVPKGVPLHGSPAIDYYNTISKYKNCSSPKSQTNICPSWNFSDNKNGIVFNGDVENPQPGWFVSSDNYCKKLLGGTIFSQNKDIGEKMKWIYPNSISTPLTEGVNMVSLLRRSKSTFPDENNKEQSYNTLLKTYTTISSSSYCGFSYTNDQVDDDDSNEDKWRANRSGQIYMASDSSTSSDQDFAVNVVGVCQTPSPFYTLGEAYSNIIGNSDKPAPVTWYPGTNLNQMQWSYYSQNGICKNSYNNLHADQFCISSFTNLMLNNKIINDYMGSMNTGRKDFPHYMTICSDVNTYPLDILPCPEIPDSKTKKCEFSTNKSGAPQYFVESPNNKYTGACTGILTSYCDQKENVCKLGGGWSIKMQELLMDYWYKLGEVELLKNKKKIKSKYSQIDIDALFNIKNIDCSQYSM